MRKVIFVLLMSPFGANADIIAYLYESGDDVLAFSSGTIETPDAASSASFQPARVVPASGVLEIGGGNKADYYAVLSGPTSFGVGDGLIADDWTGPLHGIYGFLGLLYVPTGYLSGSYLESTATWYGVSLADLGLTEFDYVWTWTGAFGKEETFTLRVGTTPVPEPGTLALLGLGLAALGLNRRSKIT